MWWCTRTCYLQHEGTKVVKDVDRFQAKKYESYCHAKRWAPKTSLPMHFVTVVPIIQVLSMTSTVWKDLQNIL